MDGLPRVFSARSPALRERRAAAPAESSIRGRGGWVPGRDSRIATLIIAILLSSLADLGLTLTFLTSVGMAEANPIARAIIGTGSAAVVVGFKVVLSLAACSIFWLARRRASGEIGAWVGAMLMCWLMIRWHDYIDHSHFFTGVLEGRQHQSDSRWVALGE